MAALEDNIAEYTLHPVSNGTKIGELILIPVNDGDQKIQLTLDSDSVKMSFFDNNIMIRFPDSNPLAEQLTVYDQIGAEIVSHLFSGYELKQYRLTDQINAKLTKKTGFQQLLSLSDEGRNLMVTEPIPLPKLRGRPVELTLGVEEIWVKPGGDGKDKGFGFRTVIRSITYGDRETDNGSVVPKVDYGDLYLQLSNPSKPTYNHRVFYHLMSGTRRTQVGIETNFNAQAKPKDYHRSGYQVRCPGIRTNKLLLDIRNKLNDPKVWDTLYGKGKPLSERKRAKLHKARTDGRLFNMLSINMGDKLLLAKKPIMVTMFDSPDEKQQLTGDHLCKYDRGIIYGHVCVTFWNNGSRYNAAVSLSPTHVHLTHRVKTKEDDNYTASGFVRLGRERFINLNPMVPMQYKRRSSSHCVLKVGFDLGPNYGRLRLGPFDAGKLGKITQNRYKPTERSISLPLSKPVNAVWLELEKRINETLTSSTHETLIDTSSEDSDWKKLPSYLTREKHNKDNWLRKHLPTEFGQFKSVAYQNRFGGILHPVINRYTQIWESKDGTMTRIGTEIGSEELNKMIKSTTRLEVDLRLKIVSLNTTPRLKIVCTDLYINNETLSTKEVDKELADNLIIEL